MGGACVCVRHQGLRSGHWPGTRDRVVCVCVLITNRSNWYRTSCRRPRTPSRYHSFTTYQRRPLVVIERVMSISRTMDQEAHASQTAPSQPHRWWKPARRGISMTVGCTSDYRLADPSPAHGGEDFLRRLYFLWARDFITMSRTS